MGVPFISVVPSARCSATCVNVAFKLTFLLGRRGVALRGGVRGVDEPGHRGGVGRVPWVMARPRLPVQQPQLVVHHALRPQRVLLALRRQVAQYPVDGRDLQREMQQLGELPAKMDSFTSKKRKTYTQHADPTKG